MTLRDYVSAMTERGECKCGKCFDVGNKTDPAGHTADLVFFAVSKAPEADADTFRRLTIEHRAVFGGRCKPLDGKEHGYMELGGWIGDQGRALQYMGLGALLGVFALLTPKSLLKGIPDDLAMEMAGSGLVTVQALPVATATEHKDAAAC